MHHIDVKDHSTPTPRAFALAGERANGERPRGAETKRTVYENKFTHKLQEQTDCLHAALEANGARLSFQLPSSSW